MYYPKLPDKPVQRGGQMKLETLSSSQESHGLGKGNFEGNFDYIQGIIPLQKQIIDNMG